MEHQDETISRDELKKARVDQAIRRIRRVRAMIFFVITACVVLIISIGIWAVRRPPREIPGQIFADQGQQHVGFDYVYEYNSNPPTSGPHYGDPANWGIYDYEVNDKIFIHNLEHGGMWISYRPGVSTQVIADLKGIVNEYDGSQMVMAPRAANDTDIAVAGWIRLLKFNVTDGAMTDQQKDEIRAFYRAVKNHGPEFVPGMPGIDPKKVQEAGNSK